MGKRGYPPKPTALRVLHGDPPNTINKVEPTPGPGLPDPPPDMRPAVKAVFDYMVKELAVMGLAHRPDVHQLRAYCEAVVVHAEASAHLKFGAILKDPHHPNGVKMNPAFRVQTASAATLLRYAQQFGLTPASRVHLGSKEIADDLEAERLLS